MKVLKRNGHVQMDRQQDYVIDLTRSQNTTCGGIVIVMIQTVDGGAHDVDIQAAWRGNSFVAARGATDLGCFG